MSMRPVSVCEAGSGRDAPCCTAEASLGFRPTQAAQAPSIFCFHIHVQLPLAKQVKTWSWTKVLTKVLSK